MGDGGGGLEQEVEEEMSALADFTQPRVLGIIGSCNHCLTSCFKRRRPILLTMPLVVSFSLYSQIQFIMSDIVKGIF